MRGARRTVSVRRSAAPIFDGYPAHQRRRWAFFSSRPKTKRDWRKSQPRFASHGGRCWDRTSDLRRVKTAL
jgi:hypothetical protein